MDIRIDEINHGSTERCFNSARPQLDTAIAELEKIARIHIEALIDE